MDRPIVNMADVARAAGVHQTTVSRALRQDPALPAQTREKICRLAEQMGYRRNPYVAALISERKRGMQSAHGAVLGILSMGPQADAWRTGSPSFQRLFEHMTDRARALGYGIEEFLLNAPGITSKRLRTILLNRGIRGLIVSPLPSGHEELEFDFSDFAAVSMRLRLLNPRLDLVAPDYFASMLVALDKLRETGHRRIAFITTSTIDQQVRHRSLGAYVAERELHPSRYLKPVVDPRWTKAGFLEWVSAKRPDALIVPIYSSYSKYKSWLQEGGWDLPKEMSLISVGCHLDTPEAGIEHNLEEEARSVVNLLTRRVECAEFGVPKFPQSVSDPGIWRDGELFLDRSAAAR